MELLRKTTKTLSQDRWCPSWDSNQASPEYKSEALPFESDKTGVFVNLNLIKHIRLTWYSP
jgi:hypothetical protein